MTRMMRFGATIGLIVPLLFASASFANEKAAEAEDIMARVAAMRAEADKLEEQAEALLAEAKAEDEEEAVKTESAETEETEAGDAADIVTASYEEGGKYFTADDIPTFKVGDDGSVDWNTFSGFRRYHSECHVCHGPDGEGSSYAPALKNSALEMDYYDFVDVVVNGRKKVGAASNSVMPSFGTNKNVMCYLDDIYVYLKARGTEDVARGRPGKKDKKSAEYKEQEIACMDG